MIRNLKVLGLALVAVFAMAAMVASAASAQQGELTSDGPVVLSGTDNGKQNALTSFGESVECEHSSYHGEAVGKGHLTTGATTFTVTPTYNTNCFATGNHKATVTMNKCDFVFHIGNTTGVAEQYAVTADLVCPVGADVEVHVYFASNNENLKVCKITLKGGAENQGLTGGVVTNDTNAKGETTDTVTLSGTVGGITATKSGLCGHAETKTGQYDLNVAVKGINGALGETGITVTE